jgi:hypothetical protein
VADRNAKCNFPGPVGGVGSIDGTSACAAEADRDAALGRP